MTTIFLQRHVNYSNPRNIMPFRMPNIALSDEGKKQVESLAEFYKDKNISVIYSSPLKRAKESAEFLALNIWQDSVKRIFFDTDLLETLTPIQGVLVDEYDLINENKSLYANKLHSDFGGESADEIFLRMNKCIKKILAEHKGENIIVSSHADPIMIYSMKVRGIDVDINIPLWKQAKFIPMGGTMKLTFDDEGKVVEFEEVNY